MRLAVLLLGVLSGGLAARVVSDLDDSRLGPKVHEARFVDQLRVARWNQTGDDDGVVTMTPYEGNATLECRGSVRPLEGNRRSRVYADALAKDKAVVYWTERSNDTDFLARMRMYSFPSCETVEFRLWAKADDPTIVTWGGNMYLRTDTLEVFYVNSDKDGQACCQQTFALEDGRALGEPSCLTTPKLLAFLTVINPVQHEPPMSGGFLFLLYSADSADFVHLTSEHRWRLLARYPTEGRSRRRYPTSSSNNLLGICYERRDDADPSITRAECSQFDAEGAKLREVKLDLDDSARISGLYNLPEGGFLTLTNRCVDDCYSIDSSLYSLGKLSADGRRYRPVKVAGFPCNYTRADEDMQMRFFLSDAGEYCLAMVCYKHPLMHDDFAEMRDRYRATTRCFSDEALSIEM